MLNSLKRLWAEHPLLAIILIAILPRLVAVVFSKGYGMHDDHFEVIEQPFMVIHDISFWDNRGEPEGHSVVYPSIQYFFLNAFDFAGIEDPQTAMFLIRLLHAIYSLLIVYYGFKITEILSNREIAKKVGLLLALFWALPFLSVRNLVEVVCIPPIMAGFYYTLNSRDRSLSALIAGLWFGLAFAFRYQTLTIAGMVGLMLLFQKEFRQSVYFTFGFLLSAILIQGGADVFAWGYPFASFIKYVNYNISHGQAYTTGPWYNYTLLVIGALIPPISIFLIYGFWKKGKKILIIFLPVLMFFILHSIFPNKQERFILPVIPLILLLGVIGWEEYIINSSFWSRHRRALKSIWAWFWIINTILLFLFSTYYSKKSRVEAMYTLYGKDVSGVILVGGKIGATQPPLFYTGVYPLPTFVFNNDEEVLTAKATFDTMSGHPNYAVFFGSEDLDKRVRHIESSLDLKLLLERKIEPSFLDYVFYKLNPKYNKNETAFVYLSKK